MERQKKLSILSQDPFSLSGLEFFRQDSNLLPPGSTLDRNRYRLVEQQTFQQWGENTYESSWKAQDFHNEGAPVIIQEVMIPTNSALHSHFRSLIKALFIINQSPQTPTFL